VNCPQAESTPPAGRVFILPPSLPQPAGGLPNREPDCYTQPVLQPRLNLLAPAALTGLLYRVLAGCADPAEAELTRRSLEQLQEERTELMKEISSLRADVDILNAQAAKTRHDAKQAQLDLELFERQAPATPKRGLLQRKLTPEQQATEQQRAQLRAIAERNATEQEAVAKQELTQRRTLEQLEQMIGHLMAQRSAQSSTMQEQLAARVLNLVAAGHAEEAHFVLEDTRRLLRGDMMVALLHVVTALLTGGVEAALPVFGEFRLVFSQQGETVSRVLSALLAVSRGRQLNRHELGLLPAENFSAPAFFRLYQLVRVLAGWDFDTAGVAGHPAAATLFIASEYLRGATAPEQGGAQEIAEWSAQSGDLIDRTIGAMLLSRWRAAELLPCAAGVNLQELNAPQRPNEQWPRLWDLLGEEPLAWPRALDKPWRAALACLLLLSARAGAPQELFDAWLAESYNWPKTDFYWWTLARVNDDDSLLTNLTGAGGQLVSVAPV
jgi:hypothetical protein